MQNPYIEAWELRELSLRKKVRPREDAARLTREKPPAMNASRKRRSLAPSSCPAREPGWRRAQPAAPFDGAAVLRDK